MVKADLRSKAEMTKRTEDEISAERSSMARANELFRERVLIQDEAAGRGLAIWGRISISDQLARQISLRIPVPEDEEAGVH